MRRNHITMPVQVYAHGPWYRGGVPRSYVPPSIFASVGCAVCLVSFSVMMIIGGGAMYGMASASKRAENEPPFDSEFFKKHRSNMNDGVMTAGGVILGIGCIMFVTGIGMCIIAGYLARKQENRRITGQQNPFTTATPQPPPPCVYPQQPPSQNVYPPAGSYPSQPFGSDVPTGGQYQYPSGYYPPPASTVPSSQYPPPSYTRSAAPNAPPQGGDCMEKQPLDSPPTYIQSVAPNAPPQDGGGMEKQLLR